MGSDHPVALGRGSAIGPCSPSARCLVLFGRQQPGGLDEVVGKYPEATPQLGTLEAVQQGACPAEAVLELADAALAAGAPLHQPTKPPRSLDPLAGGAGAALAENRDPRHAKGGHLPLHTGLAIATVGGDCPWRLAGAGDDPPDGGGQQRRVGWV